jgi:hypothetical protein
VIVVQSVDWRLSCLIWVSFPPNTVISGKIWSRVTPIGQGVKASPIVADDVNGICVSGKETGAIDAKE